MKNKISKFFMFLVLFLVAAFIFYQFFGWHLAVIKYNAKVRDMLSCRQDEIFKPGEKLVYTLRYMGLPAGKGIICVENIKEYNNRPSYSLNGRLRTSDFISLFFEAEGQIRSYMDKEKLHSLCFEEQSQASGHRKNQKVVTFNQENLFLEVDGERVVILPDTQDPLSAFYFLRLLDCQKIEEGYEINIKTRKRDRTLFLKLEGREELNTPFGKIPVIKVFLHLKPVKATSRHEISGFVWFTDNEKRIPVMVKLKTKAGPAALLLYDVDL
ncbi:MAG: DUF3108 domain-containing protein [Candidatus Omnitrophota bacterium]